MKIKYIILALGAVMCAASPISAQIYESTSSSKTKIVIKKPNNMSWFGTVGGALSLADYQYRDNSSMQPGFHIDFGMEKPFKRGSDAFWGVKLGFASLSGGYDAHESIDDYDYIASYDKYSYLTPSVFIGPIVGLHKSLNDNVILDLHFSPQFHYNFVNADDMVSHYGRIDDDGARYYYQTSYGRIDESMAVSGELGAGLWFNRFIVDLSYRFDFMLDSDDTNYYHNVVLSIGYAFKVPAKAK